MATYNRPQLISQRSVVNPPLSASLDRYQFLNIRDAEPNLGVASGELSAKYFLTSNTQGTRSFTNDSNLVLGGNNLGIGNNYPQYPLDVNGDINITGNYRKNGVIVSVSGFSGFSGYSGFTGFSGYSGYSGLTGISGYSGYSSFSGYSGTSGYTGISGYSGFTGYSGYTGYSGVSGYTGYSGIGTSGFSGFSGNSGFSGLQGYSGYTGISGFSGYSGPTGTSGYSGYTGYSGISGSGVSGFSGFSGLNGYSGYSGISGYTGYSGITGISGYSGYSGISGSGVSGYSGYTGYSGTAVNISSELITYPNTFVPGNVVRLDSYAGVWYLAQADSAVDAETTGVIQSAAVNQFYVVFDGLINGLGSISINGTNQTMNPGECYYLSDVTPGGLVTYSPSAFGTVSKPVMRAITTSQAMVVNERGILNSGVVGNRVSTRSVSTSAYTLTTSDYYVGVNYNGTATIQLPASVTGTEYIIKDESGLLNGTTNVIIVSANPGNTIDGLTKANLVSPYARLTLVFNNNWNVV